jgi:uncharacterized membrane protein YdjX (TVP38/TMEM64 family)
MKKDLIGSVISIIIIVGVFIFLSYIVETNLTFFKAYLDFGFFGMFIFLIILILSIVIVPIAAFPLFPLASGLWGWVIAGTLGVVGWTIGSIIAFWLARKYGVNLIERFFPIEKIYEFEKRIPKEHLFLTVVFLTMVVAMDGISYVFGLFSKMSLRDYTLATIIGLVPFTFVLAYVGSMPFYYTVLFLIIGLVILAIGMMIAYLEKKMKSKGGR